MGMMDYKSIRERWDGIDRRNILKEQYNTYISSSAEWDKRRKLILELYDGRCMLCDCDKEIEIHHKTYERLGGEWIEDLVPLCREHHEMVTDYERRERYRKRKKEYKISSSINEPEKMEIKKTNRVVWLQGLTDCLRHDKT